MIDRRLQGFIEISKTILKIGIQWIRERILSVNDDMTRLAFMDIIVDLKVELLMMKDISDLGSKIKEKIFQANNEK